MRFYEEQVRISMSEEFKQAIESSAYQSSKSVGEYIRDVLFNGATPSEKIGAIKLRRGPYLLSLRMRKSEWDKLETERRLYGLDRSRFVREKLAGTQGAFAAR